MIRLAKCIKLLLLFFIIGCGKTPPNDAFLITEVEKILGLKAYPHNYAGSAAMEQLSGREKLSAWANTYDVLHQSIDDIQVIKRGKVVESNPSAHQQFIVKITGSATLSFLYTPSANWRENEMRQRTVTFAKEEEFTVFADEYGEWKVMKQFEWKARKFFNLF